MEFVLPGPVTGSEPLMLSGTDIADEENEDDPLDLLPEPLPDPDPDPEPDADPDPEPDPDPDAELCAGAGMSLWTQTPSARRVFVPGTWTATVRAGASIRSTDSTGSSTR